MNLMSKAKTAVVIPAYNVSRCLRDAVESVLNQTLHALEVWIVDDGSIDSTGVFADSMLRMDARVRVLHQPNRGAYMARLNALRRIKTPYFAFLDADDRVEPQMYKSMLEWAEAEHLDVVQCRQYGDVRADGNRTILGDRKAVEQNVIRPFLLEGQGALFVWDKLYRNIYDFSSFVNAPITMFDDMVFNLQFFKGIGRMGFLNEGLYHYQVNDGSSVRNYKPKNLQDFLYTVRFRMSMSDVYGWRDTSIALDRWILLNARNQLMIISVAPNQTWRARCANLKSVLTASEIRAAYVARRGKDKTAVLFLMMMAYTVPKLFLLIMGAGKRMKGFFKR